MLTPLMSDHMLGALLGALSDDDEVGFAVMMSYQQLLIQNGII